MLIGRIVWVLVSAIIYTFMGAGFTWTLFFMGGFVNAIPGIIIQLILIPVLVGIDGRCGSGKTTLGEYLYGKFDCNLFHMEDFFWRIEQRTPERMTEVGGN